MTVAFGEPLALGIAIIVFLTALSYPFAKLKIQSCLYMKDSHRKLLFYKEMRFCFLVSVAIGTMTFIALLLWNLQTV